MALSIQVPTVGQANSTEAVKVSNSLTNLSAWANGQIPGTDLAPAAAIADTQIASPNNAVRKLLLETDVMFVPTLVAATYFGTVGGGNVANGTAVATPVRMWAPDAGLSSQPTDFQVATKSPFCRIRASVCANATSSGVTFTIGLYQLITLAGSSGQVAYTFGTVLAGSTIASAPTAGQAGQVESGQFAMPLSGNPHAIGVATSGTIPANSAVAVSAQLFGYNA